MIEVALFWFLALRFSSSAIRRGTSLVSMQPSQSHHQAGVKKRISDVLGCVRKAVKDVSRYEGVVV